MLTSIEIIDKISLITSSILFTLLYFPQIAKLIKTNNTKSYSLANIKITIIAYVFYIIFIIINKLYFPLVTSIINLFCVIFIYFRKIQNIEKYKKILLNKNKEIIIDINNQL